MKNHFFERIARSKIFSLVVLMLAINFVFPANDARAILYSWDTVGTAGFANGDISTLEFNPVSGEPYIAYRDVAAGFYRLTVKKYHNGAWETVGNPGQGSGSIGYLSMAFDLITGDPYVAFPELDFGTQQSELSVMKFNGTDWQYVGVPKFSVGSTSRVSIAFNPTNNTPYAAYVDYGVGAPSSGRAVVKKFNGSAWELVGTEGFSSQQISRISLDFTSLGRAIVAYSDLTGLGGEITVKSFNGASWENFGDNPIGSNMHSLSMAIKKPANVPHVIYQSASDALKATVKKNNGVSWENAGNSGFSDGEAKETDIAHGSDFTCAVYEDVANGSRASVKMLMDNSVNWLDIGTSVSDLSIYAPSIAINPITDEAYIAYIEDNAGTYLITVKKYSAHSAATPSASLPGGVYLTHPISFTLSSLVNDFFLYTTDGSTPDPSSWQNHNSEEIFIDTSTVFKAVAVKEGAQNSEVMTENYVLPSPIYRFWSPANRGHFFTSSATERDNIIAAYPPSAWTYEGAAYDSYNTTGSGLTPVYRFWSNQNQHHFYTANENEKNQVVANYTDDEWLLEGIAYYAFQIQQPGTIPAYRFWSNQNRVHFYTANEAEKNSVDANYTDNEWLLEGVTWYVPQ